MRIVVSTAAMIAKLGYPKSITLIGTTRKLVKKNLNMKKSVIYFLFFAFLALIAASCTTDGYAYRRRHGGYDSQTWVRYTKRSQDINFRTYTGYPRSRR